MLWEERGTMSKIRRTRALLPGIHGRISGMHRSMPAAVFLVVLLATLTILSACSPRDIESSELAVAKVPKSQLQAMNFLPLNGDRPGTPVDVLQYLVPGKYTIVAYLSPYDAKSVD